MTKRKQKKMQQSKEKLGQVDSYDLQRARKRKEEEIQPGSDGCRDGNFYKMVFVTNGDMGLDCQNFLRTIADKLSTKNNEPYASVISWLRIQLSFAILRNVHRCVRGSRHSFSVSEDFTFAVAGLHFHP